VLEPRNMQSAVIATVFMFVFGFFGLVFLGATLR
jgi:hypothetical protein